MKIGNLIIRMGKKRDDCQKKAAVAIKGLALQIVEADPEKIVLVKEAMGQIHEGLNHLSKKIQDCVDILRALQEENSFKEVKARLDAASHEAITIMQEADLYDPSNIEVEDEFVSRIYTFRRPERDGSSLMRRMRALVGQYYDFVKLTNIELDSLAVFLKKRPSTERMLSIRGYLIKIRETSFLWESLSTSEQKVVISLLRTVKGKTSIKNFERKEARACKIILDVFAKTEFAYAEQFHTPDYTHEDVEFKIERVPEVMYILLTEIFISKEIREMRQQSSRYCCFKMCS